MIEYANQNNTGFMMSLGNNLILGTFDSYVPLLMIILVLSKLFKITDKIISHIYSDYCSEPIPNYLEHENKIVQNSELLKNMRLIE